MSEKFVTKLSKRKCFTLSENDTLKTASEKLQKHNIGAMPVLSTKDNNVIGIVSERDLARYIFNNEFKNDLSVTKIMSKNLITCNLNRICILKFLFNCFENLFFKKIYPVC